MLSLEQTLILNMDSFHFLILRYKIFKGIHHGFTAGGLLETTKLYHFNAKQLYRSVDGVVNDFTKYKNLIKVKNSFNHGFHAFSQYKIWVSGFQSI